MKSVWNGTLSFGLVQIPIKMFSATKSNELSFHLLHEEDMGRIHSERTCKKCGQAVSSHELVRGYEYEKGKYLPLTEQDFDKVDVGSLKELSIEEFVAPEEIDPILFDKPYYLTPDEKGEDLYALLREALKRTNKVGVAKLAFHEREHLAVIKPSGRALMLGMLYFADEIKPPKGLPLPAQDIDIGERELELAERLIESMSDEFHPERYKDTYREGLVTLINKKLEGEEITASPPKRRAMRREGNLISRLATSIQRAEQRRRRNLAA